MMRGRSLSDSCLRFNHQPQTKPGSTLNLYALDYTPLDLYWSNLDVTGTDLGTDTGLLGIKVLIVPQ